MKSDRDGERERESRTKKGQGRTTYFKTRPDSPETSKFRGEKKKEKPVKYPLMFTLISFRGTSMHLEYKDW